jgi:hypothetical protein
MPKANAQTTLGLFSEPSYISIGDEYDPPTKRAGRHGGLNIMTQNVKKGQVPQYTNFDKTFRRISDGDAYLMPGALERKWRREAWMKCRTSDGFRFTHPPKHRTGLGDVTGNFNKWPEFIPRGGMEKKTKDDIPPPAKPNILTNPVKKGSYGVHGTYMGGGTEFNYMIDPYDRPREMEMEERKKFKEKTAYFSGGKSFHTTSHARDCFDKTIYIDPEALRGGYRPEKSDKSLEGKPPFIPSQPPKSLTAFTGCFSKFPKAVPEPPDANSSGKPGEEVMKAVFIPSSPAKSMRQKSIMFRNM